MLLPFEDLEVGGFAIAASPGGGAPVGTLGGSFSVDALVTVTTRDAPEFAGAEETFRSIYENTADIDPSAEDPTVCERISVGFGLELVAASIEVE